MDPQDLQILFKLVGYTYPMSTLKRRIKLLTWDEKARIGSILGVIDEAIEKIDGIISKAAEEAGDKWP